jgi:hypothetical protein
MAIGKPDARPVKVKVSLNEEEARLLDMFVYALPGRQSRGEAVRQILLARLASLRSPERP